MVNNHVYHAVTEFAVSVNESEDKLPTFIFCLNFTKVHTKHGLLQIQALIPLLKFLSCLPRLTAIRKHVIKYCGKVYERSGKGLYLSIKNSNGVLNKLKSRSFRASSLSTYDFSSLYPTLPHNLLKEKDLMIKLNRQLIGKVVMLHVTEKMWVFFFCCCFLSFFFFFFFVCLFVFFLFFFHFRSSQSLQCGSFQNCF